MALLTIDEPVIHRGDEISRYKTGEEAVAKAHQTSQRGNTITYEILTKKAQVGPHRKLAFRSDSIFDDEPVCGDEDHQPDDDAGHQTLNHRIQAQEPGHEYLVEFFASVRHGRRPLEIFKHLAQLVELGAAMDRCHIEKHGCISKKRESPATAEPGEKTVE